MTTPPVLLPGVLTWAYPWAFLLLAFLPPVFWFARWRRRRRRGVTFTRFDAAEKMARAPGLRLHYLPPLIRFLALAALVAALARPQGAVRRAGAEEVMGADLVLALDVSDSMRAGDIPPSRLGAAKQVLEEFLRARPGDRIGVVAFSGASYTAVPLTLDHESVRETLRDLSSAAVAIDGTAIGDGLLTAVARLLEGAEPASDGGAAGRAVILATDGSNNRGGDPLQAAALAAAKGVRVDVIGLGSRERVRRWGEDDWGRNVPLTDTYGAPVYWEQLDETLLRRIAAAGGGKYFRAADRGQLAACLAEIGRLQQTVRRRPGGIETREYFQVLLLAALGLLFVERVLTRTRFRALV